ncbi:hypothetical protein ES703_123738 [subsurface metagenome]
MDVIYDLCKDPGPVDGIDGTQMISSLEVKLVEYGLDYGLTVIKGAFHCNIKDILLRYRGHLKGLHFAHPPLGMEYKDINIIFPFDSIDGGTACISGSSAQNVHFFT